MKKIIILFFLVLIFFELNAQKKTLNQEILEAIEFAETDSTTNTFYIKRPNKSFRKENVTICSVCTIEYDSINERFLFEKKKSNNIAFFKREGRYKFYTSFNDKKLKNFKKGRVGNYSQSSSISLLYNDMIEVAKKNNLLDSSITFCFFSKDRKLTNTMNLVLVNRNKGLYITNQNIVYDNIECAIGSYYGSVERFIQKKKDDVRKSTIKLDSLSDAIRIIKHDYINYLKYCPKDTLNNIKKLTEEIERVTGSLNTNEKRLIKKKILKKLKYPVKDVGSFGISFYDKDISRSLASILIREQFNEYLNYRSFYSNFNYKAINYLAHNFNLLKNENLVGNQYPNFESYIISLLCKNK